MLLTAGTEGQGHQAELFPCDMEEQGELTKERVGSGASSRTVSGSESSYSEPEAVAPRGAKRPWRHRPMRTPLRPSS